MIDRKTIKVATPEPVSLRFKSSERKSFDGETAFNRMRTTWKQIAPAHRGNLDEAVYTFAGGPVRIRGIGSELAGRINRPFQHLRSSDLFDATLKIDFWDEEATSSPCPMDSMSDSLRCSVDYGYVIGGPQDRFVGCYSAQISTWFDRASARIVACVAKRKQLSLDEQGKPFHFPLLVWHTDRDVPVIHAGLIARDGRGALLAGKGGTGKSTVAMACLDAGFDYIGDDYVALTASEDGLMYGHSLYNTTWLEPTHMRRFPTLVPHAIAGGKKKLPVLLAEVTAGKLAKVAPIRVVLLPRIKDHPGSQVLPASKRDALLALTPTSMIRLPVSSARGFEKIADMINLVPCYWLEFGPDLSSIPETIEKLLAQEIAGYSSGRD